jgi:hypothetical protein
MGPFSGQSWLISASVSANFFSSRFELECPIEDVVYLATIYANYAGAEDYRPITKPLYVLISYPKPP